MLTITCSRCKKELETSNFNKCKSNKNGYSYQCKACRKEYNQNNREAKKEYNKQYYAKNKDQILEANKQYRINNVETISLQRKEYRAANKDHIKMKNKEYLPTRKFKIKIKRQSNLNFKLSEVLRSKIHKMLQGRNTSYAVLIGCDIDTLIQWLEFQFDKEMNWDNFGSYWEIDHILAINQFDFTNELDKRVCFNWTNLQPLTCLENKSKSDKLLLHYYYNSIVSVHRFIQKYKKNTIGYQDVRESLHWLREKLRYGKNATDN